MPDTRRKERENLIGLNEAVLDGERMKHAKGVLLIFAFLFVFGSMNIPLNNMAVLYEDVGITQPVERMLPSYTPHGVINIFNDTDFATQAASESWPGSGNETHPYLIQGYSINTDVEVSVYIQDVTAYFEMRDCLISSSTHQNVGGVQLINVTHGHLENCYISYKNTGLDIDNCDGLTVVNCTMDNNAAGATVEASNYTSFTDCSFTNTTTGSGFYQDSSHWTSIINCVLNYNGDYGLESYWSDHFSFTGNEVTGNDYAGLLVENSHYGEYHNNMVFANGEEGIILFDCHRATVTENTIYDNDRYGLSLVGPEYGVFSHNTIYNNTLDGINYDTGGHSVVDSNDVFDNGWTNFHLGASACGMNIEIVTNVTVTGNQVHNNSLHGINLRLATDSVIQDNEVWENYGVMGECGIYVESSTFCNVTANLVYNNTQNGITIDTSDDCIVTHNIVYDNTLYGIYLVDCNRTILYYNDMGWNPTNARDLEGVNDINYWDNGEVGNWYSDYDGSGAYNISGTPNQRDFHPSNSLVVGTISDIQYELGSTGNTLFLGAQALNPDYYEVIAGSATIGTIDWNGGDIHANVDGLDVGVYEVTITAFHVSGHYLSEAANVTVVDTSAPAWVQTPMDQTINVGDWLSFEVRVSEFSEVDDWIVNDTLHFSIDGYFQDATGYYVGLITNATTLEAGTYGLNITAVDIYGNSVSAIITIHVLAPSTPPGGGDPTGLLLIAAGGGAAAVIIILLVIFTKKKKV